jgi:hypothetical protein
MAMTRRMLVGIGIIAMTAGLVGAVFDPGAGFGAFVFLAAVLVLHDGVFLPLVGLLGRRIPVAAGVVGVSVAVVGLPFALGFGKDPGNPSALPLAYPRNLVLILIVVLLAAIGKGMVRRRRRPRTARRE